MARNQHLDEFMKSFLHEALTFDDVSLVTQYADFLPQETDISSRLTTRINLNIPLVSAAMDTVKKPRWPLPWLCSGVSALFTAT